MCSSSSYMMRSLPVNMFHQTHAGTFTAWLGTLPSSPVLVVFDSLSRSMIGGDESSNQDMSSIVANMDRIRHLYGALVVQHTGHGDQTRERGASALMSAADSRISVTRPDTDALRVQLKVVKIKDAARPAPIVLLEEIGQSLAIVNVSSAAQAKHDDTHARSSGTSMRTPHRRRTRSRTRSRATATRSVVHLKRSSRMAASLPRRGLGCSSSFPRRAGRPGPYDLALVEQSRPSSMRHRSPVPRRPAGAGESEPARIGAKPQRMTRAC